MNLKASTRYTEQIVKDYLWFNICPRRAYRQIIPAVFGICSAIFLVMAALYLVTLYFVFMYIAFAMLLVVPFLANYIFFKPKKTYRTYQRQVENPNMYNFYSEQFQVRSDRTVLPETEIAYSDLYRAYETKDYFLLYTMRRKACIVGKQDFEVGSPDALRQKLKEKMGKRFKVLMA
jgi:hypothetical protein